MENKNVKKEKKQSNRIRYKREKFDIFMYTGEREELCHIYIRKKRKKPMTHNNRNVRTMLRRKKCL